MDTTFIALSSMSGIVFASDTDHTIYQLSQQQPVVVAVNSYSPIPWDYIINSHKRKQESECKKNIEDYAIDFVKSFPNIMGISWHNLSPEDRKIIFMGYGLDDLFPSVYETIIAWNETDNKIEIGNNLLTRISHQNLASINLLGNLESVSTIFWGATQETKDILLKKHLEQFEIYKQRILEKFKGTEYEEFVIQKLADYDSKEVFTSVIKEASDSTFSNIQHGIDSFSIEEMVTAAETIVDAEIRLDHLSSGHMGPLHSTRELAVITRVEGLTWIKHSLFAL